MSFHSYPSTLSILVFILAISGSENSQLDQQRRDLGKSTLDELHKKTQSSSCWREAVARLNSTCKKLSDIEQSRLAVSFANCHLAKSGREVYHCNDSMSVLQCTEAMDPVAFQTYTEFFTHTGHICYFLQSELWQERTEGVISKLSDTSAEAVNKLEQALDYHKELEKKQNQALDNQAAILDQDRRIAFSLDDTRRSMDSAFLDMNEMAQKQKLLLVEMFGTLQNSVDNVRYLMSLFLIEFVGYETFVVFVVSCLVVQLLPRIGYSRFKLYFVLFCELVLEIVVRKTVGYYLLRGGGAGTRPPPESMETLHSWLWYCRYAAFFVGLLFYLREWWTFRDNALLLNDIQKKMDLIMQRLGIELSADQGQVSAPPAVQGGPPPPPTETDTPVECSELLSRESEVPHGSQPSELMSRGTPIIGQDSIDGCVLSAKNSDTLAYQPTPVARGGRSGIQRSAYHFEPIPGLDPPIGHPDSPYTNQMISQYIAGLPAQFDPPGEQSFASTLANPPDSDNDQSNDTVILSEESESPLARPPLNRASMGKQAGLNKNKSGGGGVRGSSGVGGRVPLPINNESLLNVSPGNRREEWAESEKEVSEEKTVASGKLNSSKLSSRPGRRSRRTEPVAPSTPTLTPTLSRRHTLQASTPTATPHRYNLRYRTPK